MRERRGGPTPSRGLTGGEVLRDPLVRELLEARLVGVLATIEPDGAVHAVPLWYASDGEAIVLATGSASRKVRNLRRDRRVTLVLHDSRPGFEICRGLHPRRSRARRGRRRGTDRRARSRALPEPGRRAPPAAREFLASDDLAIRLHPVAAVTWDERTSLAARELRLAGGALPLEPTAPCAAA